MPKTQARARKLQVYHWQGHRQGAPKGGQTREIVACYSKREARSLTDHQVPIDWISESTNEQEIQVATKEPGTIFWRPLDQRPFSGPLRTVVDVWTPVVDTEAKASDVTSGSKSKKKFGTKRSANSPRKSAWSQQHDAYLAQQADKQKEQHEASKFVITDRLGPLEPSVEATVDAISLVSPSGTMLRIKWDPYIGGFEIRAVEVHADVTAGSLEVVPNSSNVVGVRARQGVQLVPDPIGLRLAEGAAARKAKRGKS